MYLKISNLIIYEQTKKKKKQLFQIFQPIYPISTKLRILLIVHPSIQRNVSVCLAAQDKSSNLIIKTRLSLEIAGFNHSRRAQVH